MEIIISWCNHLKSLIISIFVFYYLVEQDEENTFLTANLEMFYSWMFLRGIKLVFSLSSNFSVCVYLSLCLCISLLVYPSISRFPSPPPSLSSFSPSVSPPPSPSLCLFISLSAAYMPFPFPFLSFCLSSLLHLSSSLSLLPPPSLFVCLSVFLPVCLPVCPDTRSPRVFLWRPQPCTLPTAVPAASAENLVSGPGPNP